MLKKFIKNNLNYHLENNECKFLFLLLSENENYTIKKEKI